MQVMSPSVQLNKVGFIVLDMQPPLLRVIAGSEPVVRRCSFVIEAAKLLGFPLCFTEQVPEKLQHTLPPLKALAGTAPVFPKTTFYTLENKDFTNILKGMGCSISY